MASSFPLFSIVIPTRNRAHLLPRALSSALNQQFDDYEIVVVANHCQDNTREQVKKMANSRVRYIETNETLSMPNNWEFAWNQAKGKYITYLADDDALVPSALKYLAENALEGNPEVVAWEDATYYYPDWNDANLQNILLMFTTGTSLIDDLGTSELRKQLADFTFSWNAPIPKMLNCILQRDFFEDWRKRLGTLFYPTSPDYSLAWIVAHICSSYRLLRRPLTVRGVSDTSIGSNSGLGPQVKEFLKEFGKFDFFAKTKLNIPIAYNYLADTFLRINPMLLENSIQPEPIDPKQFALALAKQLHESQPLLENWENHVKEYLDHIQSIFPDLYDQINMILSHPFDKKEGQESLRDMHARTRQMALEYLPNLEIALKKYSGDLQAALGSLALLDEILPDSNWSYLYLFGEKLDSHDVYTMSTHVDRYYNLLCKVKKIYELSQLQE